MIKQVIKLLEERRGNLVALFESGNIENDAARQHQVYGAISEIDLMMDTLKYYQDKRILECLKQREGNLIRLE